MISKTTTSRPRRAATRIISGLLGLVAAAFVASDADGQYRCFRQTTHGHWQVVDCGESPCGATDPARRPWVIAYHKESSDWRVTRRFRTLPDAQRALERRREWLNETEPMFWGRPLNQYVFEGPYPVCVGQSGRGPGSEVEAAVLQLLRAEVPQLDGFEEGVRAALARVFDEADPSITRALLLMRDKSVLRFVRSLVGLSDDVDRLHDRLSALTERPLEEISRGLAESIAGLHETARAVREDLRGLPPRSRAELGRLGGALEETSWMVALPREANWLAGEKRESRSRSGRKSCYPVAYFWKNYDRLVEEGAVNPKERWWAGIIGRGSRVVSRASARGTGTARYAPYVSIDIEDYRGRTIGAERLDRTLSRVARTSFAVDPGTGETWWESASGMRMTAREVEKISRDKVRAVEFMATFEDEIDQAFRTGESTALIFRVSDVLRRPASRGRDEEKRAGGEDRSDRADRPETLEALEARQKERREQERRKRRLAHARRRRVLEIRKAADKLTDEYVNHGGGGTLKAERWVEVRVTEVGDDLRLTLDMKTSAYSRSGREWELRSELRDTTSLLFTIGQSRLAGAFSGVRDFSRVWTKSKLIVTGRGSRWEDDEGTLAADVWLNIDSFIGEGGGVMAPELLRKRTAAFKTVLNAPLEE